MRFLCTGLNYRTAPLKLREKVSFSRDGIPGLLEHLSQLWPDSEIMVLSTCNRTEIYTTHPVHGRPRQDEIRDWFRGSLEMESGEPAKVLYELEDEAAVEHLFRVTAGLDSLVPGENEIVAQVKEARAAAVDAGTAGGTLCGLVDEALRTAKIVRTETGISEGRVSVASVAVDCINHVFESLKDRTILSVGSGKMNRVVLENISCLCPAGIMVLNRSPLKSESLADRYGGSAVPFENLADAVLSADVVVTSTSSREPIITVEMIAAAQKKRLWRPMLVMDLAVPRDVESEVGGLENVFLYNIDDLEDVVASSFESRKDHIRDGDRLVSRCTEEYIRKTALRDAAPVIDALYRRLDEIIESELQEASRKLASHNDMEEDLEILRRAVRSGLRKFCHPAVDNLRQSGDASMTSRRAEVLRRLFELD